MKAITDTLGVARSNIIERVKGLRQRRGPQTRPGDLISAAYYAAHRVAARYSLQATTARRSHPEGTLPRGQARTITGLVISLLMAIVIVKATGINRAIRVDLDIGILFVVLLLVFVVPRFLRK
jgi:hypothetical protein